MNRELGGLLRDGFYMAFVGPDGGGKTDNWNVFGQYLEEELGHKRVIMVREPGGTPLGDRVRELVLSDNGVSIGARAEFLLFTTSRAQLIEQIVIPALDQRKVVVSDRCFYESLAYQSFGRCLNFEDVFNISMFAIRRRVPDLVMLLDIPVDEGMFRKRAQIGQVNRFEKEELEYHERVRSGFLVLAEREPKKFEVIDALKPFDEVQQEIRDRFRRWIYGRAGVSVFPLAKRMGTL